MPVVILVMKGLLVTLVVVVVQTLFVFVVVLVLLKVLVLLGFRSSCTFRLTLALRVTDDPSSSNCRVLDCEVFIGKDV